MSFEKEFEIMRKAAQAGVAFHHAMGIMFYDAETVAPEKSVEGRGRTLSFLGDIEYGMMTDPELIKAVDTLTAHKDEFGPDEQREIDLSKKQLDSIAKVPKDEYLKAIVLQDEATYYWKKAKEASDYSIFASWQAGWLRRRSPMTPFWTCTKKAWTWSSATSFLLILEKVWCLSSSAYPRLLR